MKLNVVSLLAIVCLSGCSSYESTLIQEADGTYSKGPKADGFGNLLSAPRKGMPMLDVCYRLADGSLHTQSVQVGDLVDMPYYIPLLTDAKRPAAGTAKTTVAMTENQVTALTTDVTDTTIASLADAAVKLKELAPNNSGTADLEEISATQRSIKLPTGATFISQTNYINVYNSLNGKWERSIPSDCT